MYYSSHLFINISKNRQSTLPLLLNYQCYNYNVHLLVISIFENMQSMFTLFLNNQYYKYNVHLLDVYISENMQAIIPFFLNYHNIIIDNSNLIFHE